MTETLLNINTDFTPKTPINGTVALATGVVKPSTYDNVRFEATIYLSTTGTSNNQGLTLNLIITNANGATQTLTTWPIKAAAAIQQIPLHVVYVGNTYQGATLTQGGVVTLSVTGAAADAQTTLTVSNIYVTGVE